MQLGFVKSFLNHQSSAFAAAPSSSSLPFKLCAAYGLAPFQAAANAMMRFQCCWMGQLALPIVSCQPHEHILSFFSLGINSLAVQPAV